MTGQAFLLSQYALCGTFSARAGEDKCAEQYPPDQGPATGFDWLPTAARRPAPQGDPAEGSA